MSKALADSCNTPEAMGTSAQTLDSLRFERSQVFVAPYATYAMGQLLGLSSCCALHLVNFVAKVLPGFGHERGHVHSFDA